MSETSGAAEPRPAGLVRGLGLLDATLLIVGSVIGSGIFFAPSIMAGYLLAINTGFVVAVAVASPRRSASSSQEWARSTRSPPSWARRSRRRSWWRSYRAWGYPVVPLLFVAVSLFFLVYMPVADPRNTGLGLLLTAAGIPAYLYWRRHR